MKESNWCTIYRPSIDGGENPQPRNRSMQVHHPGCSFLCFAIPVPVFDTASGGANCANNTVPCVSDNPIDVCEMTGESFIDRAWITWAKSTGWRVRVMITATHKKKNFNLLLPMDKVHPGTNKSSLWAGLDATGVEDFKPMFEENGFWKLR